MEAGTQALATVANHWLGRFEAALSARDTARLQNLFHSESHWRDVLALTWRIRTVSGPAALAAELLRTHAQPTGFGVDPNRTPPRYVTRAGTKCIEALLRFETTMGQGAGVVRLLAGDSTEPKAWTLLTALEELKGHEEHTGKLRPTGQSYSRDFGGPNWLDLRKAAAAYADRDPTVLVVGGGQAGLSIAARLTQRSIDTLIVDRWPRIGDNWRQRYHALTLHNQVHVNHLPYMPFPPSWPIYIPKDKLANWFEAYAEATELNYWTSTEFEGGTYDESARLWTVTLKREGQKRVMYPRHVVMATGVSGIPSIPDIPTLRDFGGKVIHASEYGEAAPWKGKNVLVLGTGTSAHDIAQDLYSAGAHVTIVQRSPTLIINCDPSAQLVYSLYSEGPPLEDCDLITVSVPLPVARRTHQLATQHAKELDRGLLERLEEKGFRLTDGEDGTGWQFMYLTRGGGYYFNVGCSELVVEGKVGLVQYAEFEKLLPDTDLVVLATGYKGQEELVRRLFGDEMAARVGPVWGFGEGQELRNMFTRTPQPGLWFIAGSFAQCRIYSKYLALQLQASELGLI
jgi:hypothetical protein